MLPCVAARLTATASLFLTTEGTADFSAGCADVAVNEAAVAAQWADPLKHILHALRKEGRGETLWHTIVVLDGLFQILESEDVHDGSEDFLVHDLCIWTDLNDGWLDVITGAWQLFATVKDAATLGLDLLEALQVLAHTLLAVHGSHESALGHWVANGNRFVGLDHAGDKSIIDRVVKVDPS